MRYKQEGRREENVEEEKEKQKKQEEEEEKKRRKEEDYEEGEGVERMRKGSSRGRGPPLTILLHRRCCCVVFTGHFPGVQDEFDVDDDSHDEEENSAGLWQEGQSFTSKTAKEPLMLKSGSFTTQATNRPTPLL